MQEVLGKSNWRLTDDRTLLVTAVQSRPAGEVRLTAADVDGMFMNLARVRGQMRPPLPAWVVEERIREVRKALLG